MTTCRDAAKDAVVAIGQRVGDRSRASEPVLAAYNGASAPAKVSLLAVLGETGGDEALQELTQAAKGTDDNLKQAAVRALAETWGDTRPLPTLLSIAKSDPNKGQRVQALRGYLRLVGQDEATGADDKVTLIEDAFKVAERPEEKRQALSLLRDIRTASAVDLAARYLSDKDLFSDAADTIIYLAGPQRKNNRELPAVRGATTTAALDQIIDKTNDDSQRTAAQKVR